MSADLSVERTDTGWFFWLKWVLGSTIGWIVVFALSFVAIGAVVEALWGNPETAFGEDSLAFAAVLTAVFTVSFVGLGSVQWLLLRRRLGRMGWWAPASGVGGLIVAVLYFALVGVVGEVANEIIHNAAAGTVVGLLQWRILRGRVAHAQLWVPVTALGFVLAGGGAAVVSAVTGMDAGDSAMIGIPAMSALTGAGMVWLLRQPLRPE